jgi:hypothetical protein
MAELFNAFAVAKAGRSKHCLYAMRFYRQRFAPLDKVIARDLKHRKIDECLEGVPGAMRNALLRYLRAVMNFEIRRGWLSFNPVTHLSTPKADNRAS